MNLVTLRQIVHRRLLPQRLQRNLRLQRRINLPSRLRHRPLRSIPFGADFFQLSQWSYFRGPLHLAVELLAAKLPNRCGCQGRAFQARRRRRSPQAILDSRSGLEKRARQELDGEARSAGLKSAKTGVSCLDGAPCQGFLCRLCEHLGRGHVYGLFMREGSPRWP